MRIYKRGSSLVESSPLLRVAIYEYNNFNEPIELSYALLTAKHPVTIVLQTLVHAFLLLTQSPALLMYGSSFANNMIFHIGWQITLELKLEFTSPYKI